MDEPHEGFLQDVRPLFCAYYSTATPDDATWFDALIVAHAALTRGVSLPRELVPADDRQGLERACDKAERTFMRARDRVRECPTFRKLVRVWIFRGKGLPSESIERSGELPFADNSAAESLETRAPHSILDDGEQTAPIYG